MPNGPKNLQEENTEKYHFWQAPTHPLKTIFFSFFHWTFPFIRSAFSTSTAITTAFKVMKGQNPGQKMASIKEQKINILSWKQV